MMHKKDLKEVLLYYCQELAKGVLLHTLQISTAPSPLLLNSLGHMKVECEQLLLQFFQSVLYRNFFGFSVCQTWGLSRLTSRAKRNKIYCRPHSWKNASTSRARTGRYSHKHPRQRGWASRICRSEQIWTWMDSMREELSSLINNLTWTLVDFPPGRKAIRCDWIYKAKKNEHGAVYRLKSRLVAQGHSQKSGIDHNDTFASVGHKVILRLVFTFVLHMGYELFQLYFDTAYSYVNLKN